MSEASGCGSSAMIAVWLAGCLVMRIALFQRHASHDKRESLRCGLDALRLAAYDGA